MAHKAYEYKSSKLKLRGPKGCLPLEIKPSCIVQQASATSTSEECAFAKALIQRMLHVSIIKKAE